LINLEQNELEKLRQHVKTLNAKLIAYENMKLVNDQWQ